MDLFIVSNWICGCEVRRICEPVRIGHIFQFSFYRNSSSIFLLSLFVAYRAHASYIFPALTCFFLGTGLSKTTAELTAVLKIGVQHPSGCELPKAKDTVFDKNNMRKAILCEDFLQLSSPDSRSLFQ